MKIQQSDHALVDARGCDEDFRPSEFERVKPDQNARQPLEIERHGFSRGAILHLPAAKQAELSPDSTIRV